MMNMQYCFPTAIFSTLNENFADEMLPIAKKYLQNKANINPNWHYKSTYFPGPLGVEVNPDMKVFVDYVNELGFQFMEKQGYILSVEKLSSFVFINEMFKGDSHGTHSHPNAILSGVFYLQVPTGSAPLVFHDPRQKKHFIYYPTKFPSETNSNIIQYEPKKGLLLMWESWLEHEVPKNNSVDGRITIAFNLYKPEVR